MAMQIIKKGDFCKSNAGHDSGTVYIVTDDREGVRVADGKYKCIRNPKIKNPKHLELLKYRDATIDSLIEAGKLQDTDIKYSIKKYLKSH